MEFPDQLVGEPNGRQVSVTVRIVGPDDILPNGNITLDLPAVPRIGDTIWLEDTHDQLLVRDVFWPIRMRRRGGQDVSEVRIPEIGCDAIDEQPEPTPAGGPRVGLDDDGRLDDFMAEDVKMVHFEAIDESGWYATVTLSDGQAWQLNFGAQDTETPGFARAEQVS